MRAERLLALLLHSEGAHGGALHARPHLSLTAPLASTSRATLSRPVRLDAAAATIGRGVSWFERETRTTILSAIYKAGAERELVLARKKGGKVEHSGSFGG